MMATMAVSEGPLSGKRGRKVACSTASQGIFTANRMPT